MKKLIQTLAAFAVISSALLGAGCSRHDCEKNGHEWIIVLETKLIEKTCSVHKCKNCDEHKTVEN